MRKIETNDPRLDLCLDEAGVVVMTLNRPEAKNALDAQLLGAMVAAFAALGRDADARVLVLKSAVAGVFSAGADLGEYAGATDDEDTRERLYAAFRGAFDGLRTVPIPTIAEMAGNAFGGGLGLALMADIRIAADDVVVGLSPAKLGLLYPFPDTRRLVSLVGQGVARDMLFSASRYNADAARRMGLLSHVVPRADLGKFVSGMARSIAALSPNSVRGLKAILNSIEDGQDSETATHKQAFLDAMGGDDFKEGVAAFLGKRPARF